MNYWFDNKNFITSSYDKSSCFSDSSLNFNFFNSEYVSFETRTCGNFVDGVFMDYNYRYDNKYYVNDVIVIDKFIKKEVI